jgi:hypothetical protein
MEWTMWPLKWSEPVEGGREIWFGVKIFFAKHVPGERETVHI